MTSTNKLERLDDLLWVSVRKSVYQKFYNLLWDSLRESLSQKPRGESLYNKCQNEVVSRISQREFRSRIINQLESYDF